MKFLGMNLMPLAVNQMPSNWKTTNGQQESLVYFFKGAKPDLEAIQALIADQEQLLSQADSGMLLPMQLTKAGYVPVLDRIRCFKPVSGSRYMPSLNSVVHFPKTSRIRAQVSNISDNTLDSVPKDQKNRLMHGQAITPARWPGMVMAQPVVTIPYHMQLEFENPISPDGMISFNWGQAITGTVGYDVQVLVPPPEPEPDPEVPADPEAPAEEPAEELPPEVVPELPPVYRTETKTQTFSIAEGLRSFKYPEPIVDVTLVDIIQAQANRTSFLVTSGGSAADNIVHDVQLTHAIVLTRTVTEAITFFVCDVGAEGSGAYIQLEKTLLQTGERPEVIRTLTGTGAYDAV